jgi:hypothetical protein
VAISVGATRERKPVNGMESHHHSSESHQCFSLAIFFHLFPSKQREGQLWIFHTRTTSDKTKMTKSKTEKARDEFDELMNKMSDVKKKWDEESGSDAEDETGHLLNQAIELALEQGRGWSPGEKEQYLESFKDDDFVSVLPAS